jgi:hypothetical protein
MLLSEDEGVRRRQLMDYVPKMAGNPSEESIGPAPISAREKEATAL